MKRGVELHWRAAHCSDCVALPEQPVANGNSEQQRSDQTLAGKQTPTAGEVVLFSESLHRDADCILQTQAAEALHTGLKSRAGRAAAA